jgi:hypothetical protein
MSLSIEQVPYALNDWNNMICSVYRIVDLATAAHKYRKGNGKASELIDSLSERATAVGKCGLVLEHTLVVLISVQSTAFLLKVHGDGQ